VALKRARATPAAAVQLKMWVEKGKEEEAKAERDKLTAPPPRAVVAAAAPVAKTVAAVPDGGTTDGGTSNGGAPPPAGAPVVARCARTPDLPQRLITPLHATTAQLHRFMHAEQSAAAPACSSLSWFDWVGQAWGRQVEERLSFVVPLSCAPLLPQAQGH
jgi:hypothetical protein